MLKELKVCPDNLFLEGSALKKQDGEGDIVTDGTDITKMIGDPLRSSMMARNQSDLSGGAQPVMASSAWQ